MLAEEQETFHLEMKLMSKDNDKNTVVALREIAEKVRLNENLGWSCYNISKVPTVEETDINDDQAVPLECKMHQISFDNFEKENAAEKKRKNILTQNEIQKLIDKKDDVNIESDIEENIDELIKDETQRKFRRADQLIQLM